MAGTIDHVLDGPRLNNPACVHHRNTIAKLRHNAEVMSNEQDGQPLLVRQAPN
ncbi:hypothetical protein SAMCCGM7_pB0217 (plasmid) [Sinorhizobium americanum CCGM7]|nr:hypothetical protein SAMCCGM7_pB0217 [Sinorhizobium americanum CCGM7]